MKSVKDVLNEKTGKMKKKPKSVYETRGVLVFGGQEESKIETPLEAWMRIYNMTREEILIKFPGKFNPDGSFR